MHLWGNFGFETDEQRDRLLTALEALGYARDHLTGEIERRDGLRELVFSVPARTWTLPEWNAWTDQMVILGVKADYGKFGGIKAVAPATNPAVLEQSMRHHRELNARQWTQLELHGVTTETVLTLEAHFWATSKPRAEALAVDLEGRLGYLTEVGVAKRGLLGRGRIWSVTGTRPSSATNPDDLGAWTDLMIETADRNGVEFDCWGTLVPR